MPVEAEFGVPVEAEGVPVEAEGVPVEAEGVPVEAEVVHVPCAADLLPSPGMISRGLTVEPAPPLNFWEKCVDLGLHLPSKAIQDVW